MKPLESQLFKFAFFPGLPNQSTTGYAERIEYLATKLAAQEIWNYTGSTNKTNPILKNYLEFTYQKIKTRKENKIYNR